MFKDFYKYPCVVREITFFSSVHELENLISTEIITRAEEKVEDKKNRLSAYRWIAIDPRIANVIYAQHSMYPENRISVSVSLVLINNHLNL